ncbi:hypothetical protein HAX54_043480, partial [Datura stramonium]|nr:hypothetical protein [Datura stramonium]
VFRRWDAAAPDIDSLLACPLVIREYAAPSADGRHLFTDNTRFGSSWKEWRSDIPLLRRKVSTYEESQFDVESFKSACRGEGACNSEAINSLYWGRSQIPHTNILQESGGQSKPIPMGILDCKADGVIALTTKTEKDVPFMKWAKYTRNKTPPPPSTSNHTSAAPLHIDKFHSPTPPICSTSNTGTNA